MENALKIGMAQIALVWLNKQKTLDEVCSLAKRQNIAIYLGIIERAYNKVGQNFRYLIYILYEIFVFLYKPLKIST